MKKFAKISLAAAVAVAGLSSVASAKPLEEAIKGVDATGYVTYQYNDRKVTDGVSTQQNVYKAALTLTVPAADDVKLKVTGTTARAQLGGDSDANAATSVSEANFTYTGVQNLTVIAGKQAMNTPWTEGSSVINNTQTGAGVLALYNAGFATLAAAHFTTNNTSTGNANVEANDISVVAAIVPVMDVATAQIWYANIGADANGALLTEGADALVVSADANIMDVAKLTVAHAELDPDKNTPVKKQELDKVILSGNAGPVALAAGYAKGGKNGSLVAFDDDASAGFKGWDVSANKTVPELKAYLLKAGIDVLPSVNLSVTHVNAKSGDSAVDGKWKETYGQITYKHNANLSAFVRYGTEKQTETFATVLSSSADDVKIKKGRLEICYKF